jgi:hypothetical protein
MSLGGRAFVSTDAVLCLGDGLRLLVLLFATLAHFI